MPFPTLSKPKPKTDETPLLTAHQSPSTPSLGPSSTLTSTSITATLDTSIIQSTTTNNLDATPPFTRPKTPPKPPSHATSWSSYHSLPPDHPVFRYPDEVREKMYAQGIDPVVKAEMDLARLGRVYGEHHHRKGFWKRGTSLMGQFGSIATGGSF